ncbi:ADP-ribosylation factor family-domain-containing protein, partial [Phakopsora pachyrhizi]
WDMRGQILIGPYWRFYYANTQAVIDMVDSNNRDQLPIVKAELLAMLSEDELKDAKLFVFENTQDQSNTFNPAQVSEGLGATAENLIPESSNKAYCICNG